jgi:hypothetical protein
MRQDVGKFCPLSGLAGRPCKAMLDAMKSIVLIFAFLLGLLTADPAGAGETWRYNHHSPEAAFPLSKRADAIRASGRCWSECGSYSTWNMVACLERNRQGRCLKLTDAADRSCQRECRMRGGPLLPIDTLIPLAF